MFEVKYTGCVKSLFTLWTILYTTNYDFSYNLNTNIVVGGPYLKLNHVSTPFEGLTQTLPF